MRERSSLDISRNWFPSSYSSPEDIFLIHATFDIALIGFGIVGRAISTTSRHAKEINSFVLKLMPPSPIFLVSEPVGMAAVLKFLYFTGTFESILWKRRLSVVLPNCVSIYRFSTHSCTIQNCVKYASFIIEATIPHGLRFVKVIYKKVSFPSCSLNFEF